MTPDTLEGSIHDLTQNILADYTAGRPIDRIEPFNQPDRDVIIALQNREVPITHQDDF